MGLFFSWRILQLETGQAQRSESCHVQRWCHIHNNTIQNASLSFLMRWMKDWFHLNREGCWCWAWLCVSSFGTMLPSLTLAESMNDLHIIAHPHTMMQFLPAYSIQTQWRNSFQRGDGSYMISGIWPDDCMATSAEHCQRQIYHHIKYLSLAPLQRKTSTEMLMRICGLHGRSEWIKCDVVSISPLSPFVSYGTSLSVLVVLKMCQSEV